eukprot:NODE_1281_length_1025_cov_92.005123_g982_i0.p2 GENE.NODE_1281_length_1025_cov_92.005123_g982_i0~~NODE_1281_length_1025_cov_92.005123_g982_i0.p2  ORF type:complete len:133 (-),score=29.96 NODE_1281_length_1025_cov_92.005123_g982_i0:335-733(-)
MVSSWCTMSLTWYRHTYPHPQQESYNNVKNWLTEINKYATENVNKLLVGNKCDLVVKKAVDFNTAKDYADRQGFPFLETSAKNATNVEQAFMTMSAEIKRRIAAQQTTPGGSTGVKLPPAGQPVAAPKKGCC